MCAPRDRKRHYRHDVSFNPDTRPIERGSAEETQAADQFRRGTSTRRLILHGEDLITVHSAPRKGRLSRSRSFSQSVSCLSQARGTDSLHPVSSRALATGGRRKGTTGGTDVSDETTKREAKGKSLRIFPAPETRVGNRSARSRDSEVDPICRSHTCDSTGERTDPAGANRGTHCKINDLSRIGIMAARPRHRRIPGAPGNASGSVGDLIAIVP